MINFQVKGFVTICSLGYTILSLDIRFYFRHQVRGPCKNNGYQAEVKQVKESVGNIIKGLVYYITD